MLRESNLLAQALAFGHHLGAQVPHDVGHAVESQQVVARYPQLGDGDGHFGVKVDVMIEVGSLSVGSPGDEAASRIDPEALQLPLDRVEAPLLLYHAENASPRRGAVAIVAAVECFMYLLAERLEVILPTVRVAKVGIVGIEHEAHLMLQTPQHGRNQVAVFGKEAGINPYVINQLAPERCVEHAVAVA